MKPNHDHADHNNNEANHNKDCSFHIFTEQMNFALSCPVSVLSSASE